jgi:hypothetical protein
VVFDRGRIISAGTGRKDPKKVLLAYLVDVKHAPFSLIRRLADQMKSDLPGLIEKLTHSRYLSPDELARFAGMMTEDLTCELFLWKEGSYRFDIQQDIQEYRLGDTALSSDAITMEAARRIDEWNRLKSGILPQTVFVPVTPPAEDAVKPNPIDDPSGYVLSMLDGATSVEYLCVKSIISDYKVYDAINTLVQNEKIIALADKFSVSINKALHRKINSGKFVATDMVITCLTALLSTMLLLSVSIVIPGSILRPENRNAKNRTFSNFSNELRVRKTTIAGHYFHAEFGFQPFKAEDLLSRKILSKRDVFFNKSVETGRNY